MRFSFTGSLPAFASRRRFSITCSGARATTVPRLSKPFRPARPLICLKSRTLRTAVFSPSNLHSLVNRTVRMGMFTPTPSVSVPLTTLRSPLCASFSTRSRYFGKRPAWCSPIPCLMNREISLPYAESKWNPCRASRIFFFSSFEQ